jgi:L-threonylcarbamoyladenylate synthase
MPVCQATSSLCVGKAADVIRSGGVVAFPTETVYGLGADAFNPDAVKKIFELKGRPPDNPLIVHIDDIFWVSVLYRGVPDWARRLMENLWPGPLSVILEASDVVPSVVRGGLPTVAVRMPAHPVALELIRLSGVPIAAPSANLSGRPSPTSAEHVYEDFGERVFILDGGFTVVGLESTVVDAREVPLKIYRLGAVTADDIERVAGVPVDLVVKPKDGRPMSPGHAYRHYAPSKPVYLFDSVDELMDFLQRSPDAIVVAMDDVVSWPRFVSLGATPREAAARLYWALRYADKMEGGPIVALMVEGEGIADAVNERLMRAAGKI